MCARKWPDRLEKAVRGNDSIGLTADLGLVSHEWHFSARCPVHHGTGGRRLSPVPAGAMPRLHSRVQPQFLAPPRVAAPRAGRGSSRYWPCDWRLPAGRNAGCGGTNALRRGRTDGWSNQRGVLTATEQTFANAASAARRRGQVTLGSQLGLACRFLWLSMNPSRFHNAVIPDANHLAKSASLTPPAARFSIILTPSMVWGRKE